MAKKAQIDRTGEELYKLRKEEHDIERRSGEKMRHIDGFESRLESLKEDRAQQRETRRQMEECAQDFHERELGRG